MKTVSKSLLTVVAVCFVSMVALAKDPSQLFVQNVKKEVIAIRLNDASQSNVHVSLKDAQGSTIFEETVATQNITRRKYDLKHLPDGKYTLHFEYDDVIKVQQLVKHFDTVEVELNQSQTVCRPNFNIYSNYVDLSMMCTDDQKISIEIRDRDGNTIFDAEEQMDGTIQKRFNLSQLEEGAYHIYVVVDGEIFNEEFSQLVNWSPSIAGL